MGDPASAIYDLADPKILDGLITWAGAGVALTYRLDLEETREFLSRYAPLPIINYEGMIPGIPRIWTDTYPGMSQLLAHLIEVHGRRRIMLVRGPKNHFETLERIRAYTTTLAKYGLPVEPNLISPPASDFGEDAPSVGVEILKCMLDERQLRPKLDFDAIATTESEYAQGVIDLLSKRGVDVPEDIAVIAFNDYLEDSAAIVPITTARKPFYGAGWRAVELLLDWLAGRPVPPTIELPAELLVRRSCGCLPWATKPVTAEPAAERGKPMEIALANHRKDILAAVEQVTGRYLPRSRQIGPNAC